jgi:RNA polymerase sigma-70 factor (ECF subfamily)
VTEQRAPAVDQTDAQLARQSGQGDAKAFGLLVERYRALLVGYVAGLLGTREDAEELAQEALLKAWQQARTLRDPATVGAWLHRIAHNLAISHVRRPRPVPLVDDPPGRAGTENDEDRSTAVLAAVGRLSEPHREVVAKKHFGGYTVEQIAGQLGLPSGTVRSRLSRAYGQLREMLAAELEPD